MKGILQTINIEKTMRLIQIVLTIFCNFGMKIKYFKTNECISIVLLNTSTIPNVHDHIRHILNKPNSLISTCPIRWN